MLERAPCCTVPLHFADFYLTIYQVGLIDLLELHDPAAVKHLTLPHPSTSSAYSLHCRDITKSAVERGCPRAR